MENEFTERLSIELPQLDAAQLARLANSLDSTPSDVVRRALLVYIPGLEEQPAYCTMRVMSWSGHERVATPICRYA